MWIQKPRQVEIAHTMLMLPDLVPIHVKMALTSTSVVVAGKTLIILCRVLATAKKVNPPNCVAVIEKGPPNVIVDSVDVHRILRPRVLGRDPGRCSGMIGAMGNTERTKIRKHDFSEK